MWEIKINELLYNPESLFGVIFECVGECPALIPFCYLAFVLLGLVFNRWGVRARKWDYLLFTCYLLLTLAITATLVEVLKVTIGRVRFCDLGDNYAGYTPFYKIGFGGRSFPSGHASMSALSLLLLDINERHNIFQKKWVITAFSTIFTLLVALSRLILGAHYLTDLLFGIAIALLTRFALKKLTRKLIPKSQRDL